MGLNLLTIITNKKR